MNKDVIYGFKCFEVNLTSQYGNVYHLKHNYYTEGEIRFGKNGFHLCTNLEDTFRYFDTFNKDVLVAYVKGYGKIDKKDDEYNGFYDMYAVQYLEIMQILTRDEIIKYALELNELRLKRFLMLFKLTEEEKEMFIKMNLNNVNILNTIEYYQNGNKDVYKKMLVK